MDYSLTISEELYTTVELHNSSDKINEMAGYLFAKLSITPNEIRLIANEFNPVEKKHIINLSPTNISISPESYTRALKHANDTKQSLILLHSHPSGYRNFSGQDNREEYEFFKSAFVRIREQLIHGSLVFPKNNQPIGRVWLPNGKNISMNKIRVLGNRYRVFGIENSGNRIPVFFDRQVRAFGSDIQTLLKSLHIAVVGTGGTGSAVCEQLIRLGIGTLSIYDSQLLDASNVNRVYGSSIIDDGIPKVRLMQRLAHSIGLGTKIIPYSRNITNKETAMTLRESDFIFGCTDDEWGRSILNDLSLRYLIPVFDVGVKIDSKESIINSIIGRVTILFPYSACLFCRQRISAGGIKAEVDEANDPETAKQLRKEGYAPELEEPNPAVISFTSSIASSAVSYFLHKLTGYMGKTRASNEILHLFHEGSIKYNYTKGNKECKCTAKEIIGSGDTRDFLGLLWG